MKPRTQLNEIHVQTLVSSTEFTKTVASKIFKVQSPALFERRIRRKVMLSAGRPLTDSSDVLPDVSGQVVYIMRIPRVVLAYGAAFGKNRQFTAKHKANS
jgi:hypothetical protein